MGGKFLFFTLIALFVLVNSHAEDDFKELEHIEDEKTNMDEEVEMDAEAVRKPRLFGRRGFGRFRSSRSSTRTTTRTTRRGFLSRRRSTSTRRGIFNRRRTSGGTGGSTTRRTGGGIGRPSLGTIVDIAQLGTDITSTIMNQIGSVERKIVVGLGNKEGLDWKAGTVYMDVGSSLELTPVEVETEEGVQLAAKKPTGVNTQGVAGCMCYQFAYIQKSFCLMFKVPYSGDNYWNVKIYDGLKQAQKETFDDLMRSSPTKAGIPVADKDLLVEDDYTIYLENCSMTNSGEAVLTVFLGVREN